MFFSHEFQRLLSYPSSHFLYDNSHAKGCAYAARARLFEAWQIAKTCFPIFFSALASLVIFLWHFFGMLWHVPSGPTTLPIPGLCPAPLPRPGSLQHLFEVHPEAALFAGRPPWGIVNDGKFQVVKYDDFCICFPRLIGRLVDLRQIELYHNLARLIGRLIGRLIDLTVI